MQLSSQYFLQATPLVEKADKGNSSPGGKEAQNLAGEVQYRPWALKSSAVSGLAVCSSISLSLACIPDLCTRVNLGRGCQICAGWFSVSRCQGYSHSVCPWDRFAASPWSWPVWSNRAVRCLDTLPKWRRSKKTNICFFMAFCERKNGAQCLVQWQVDG